MTVLEAIQARESIRGYAARPIEPVKLSRVLEAGRLAPTAANNQAVKTVVVQDPDILRKLVDACCGQAFVGTAPAFLAVCSDVSREMRCGQQVSTVDCSIALSFMMLEAAELGLGTCWLGSFLEEEVRKLLRVPAAYRIVAVTPLGYPAVEGAHKEKKPLEKFALRNHF